MKRAWPGQVLSLAACFIAGTALSADLPRRTPVPFVVDPFKMSDDEPLMIGRLTTLDWQQALSVTASYARPVYQSFDFVCRRNRRLCPARDEIHCNLRTFGKPAQEDGKWVLLSEWVNSEGCERLGYLRSHQTGMHSAVRLEGPGFGISGPEMFEDFPSPGPILP